MDNLVSVIIPIYNASEYLEYSVSSVCEQDYKNLEIILVDDNSDQLTKDKINSIKSRDSRIKVITKSKNEGVSAARNSGIEASSGEYISFVDSDDSLSPDFISRLLNAIKKTDSDLACCKFKRVKSIKNTNCPISQTDDYILKNRKEALLEFVGDNPIYSSVCWNKLYKKEVINELRFPKFNRSEDLSFCIEVCNQAEKQVFINEELYYYVFNNNSITNKNYDFSVYDMDIWDRYDQITSDFEEAETIRVKTLIRRADSIIEDYYRARKNKDKDAYEKLSVRFFEKIELIKSRNIKMPFKFRLFLFNTGIYMIARDLFELIR